MQNSSWGFWGEKNTLKQSLYRQVEGESYLLPGEKQDTNLPESAVAHISKPRRTATEFLNANPVGSDEYYENNNKGN